MFDDRYKYTQVPSPLVQPGGSASLFGFGGTTVIGEEPDVYHQAPQAQVARSGGAAPKARKGGTSQGRVIRTTAAAPKKNPAKIVVLIFVVIIVINILMSAFSYVAVVADDVFYDVEQTLDEGFDEIFGDD